MVLRARLGLKQSLFVAESNATLAEVVWRQFNAHFVAVQNTDVVFAHAARNMAGNNVAVFQLNAEHRVG